MSRPSSSSSHGGTPGTPSRKKKKKKKVVGLTEQREAALSALFASLDGNGDGVLDVDEFIVLSEILTQEALTRDAAIALLSKTDVPNVDACTVTLAEWLANSKLLARLSDEVFDELISRANAKVSELLARASSAKSPTAEGGANLEVKGAAPDAAKGSTESG